MRKQPEFKRFLGPLAWWLLIAAYPIVYGLTSLYHRVSPGPRPMPPIVAMVYSHRRLFGALTINTSGVVGNFIVRGSGATKHQVATILVNWIEDFTAGRQQKYSFVTASDNHRLVKLARAHDCIEVPYDVLAVTLPLGWLRITYLSRKDTHPRWVSVLPLTKMVRDASPRGIT
jgi:hypothetical protein